ncbi:hypothetical protein O3G_MSEX010002 [Manduca sexta]|uniref:Insulin-like domain-containing protein n=1 Tax=Manduca sexta TaxID=7130 RepID=A0A921ZFJ2_MANSE|nr:hypothetical protein O3G_MSEX010002 [Manduca sexta]
MKFVLMMVCLGLCSVFGQRAQVYCGRRLATTLAYMCPELEEETVKRSGADALFGSRDWRWAALGGARGKRGVVEECCEKPCTLDVLLTYC